MFTKIISCSLIGLFILAGSNAAKAGGFEPVTDTIPPAKEQSAETDSKKNAELIKEVPKSRKQEKPIAVTPLAIKPVIVKPKVVIKPVIKVRL